MTEQDEMIQNDKSLQCLRIELNAHTAVFLYYKVYPKSGSKRFPQNRTAIIFHFDPEHINDQVIKTYIGLAGQVDKIEQGSYVNQKGWRNQKGKIVTFVLVKFINEESLEQLLDSKAMQTKINNYIENKRNRKLQLTYDPIKEEDEDEEEEADSEGFVAVKSNSKKCSLTL
jgi:hypothetical protein